MCNKKFSHLSSMTVANFLHDLQHAPGDVVDLSLSALVGVTHAGSDVPRHHRRRHLQTSGAAHSISNLCVQETTSERATQTLRHRVYFFAEAHFMTCLSLIPFAISRSLGESSEVSSHQKPSDESGGCGYVNYENRFAHTRPPNN